MRNKNIGKNSGSYDNMFLAKKNGGKMETWNDWKDRLVEVFVHLIPNFYFAPNNLIYINQA